MVNRNHESERVPSWNKGKVRGRIHGRSDLSPHATSKGSKCFFERPIEPLFVEIVSRTRFRAVKRPRGPRQFYHLFQIDPEVDVLKVLVPLHITNKATNFTKNKMRLLRSDVQATLKRLNGMLSVKGGRGLVN